MADRQWLYIASRGEPGAISVCTVDTNTGELGPLRVAAEVNAGFLALHPRLPVLYAATREPPAEVQVNGGLRAYEIGSGGELTLLGFASTHDNGATHLALTPAGDAALICHYGGAGDTLIPLHDDGKPEDSKYAQFVHRGSSVHPQRQTRPHPHGIAIDGSGRFAFVADLGTDRIEVLAIAREPNQLLPHGEWRADPGSGPRHLAWHPDQPLLYSINELSSTIDVLLWEGETLQRLQSLRTTPQDFDGENFPAEITVHPSGRFLYASNRGLANIAVFKIQDDGRLESTQQISSGGEHPRFSGLDSTGRLFLATNMISNNMRTYVIDQQDGSLTPSGCEASIGQPMCAVFFPQSSD